MKDPRLDAADKLVEAKKKIYVQADIVGEDEMKEADAILVPAELKGDLVLLDMEFLELRLGREQSPEEKALFEKLYAALESEKAISELPLSDEEKALMEKARRKMDTFATKINALFARKEVSKNG